MRKLASTPNADFAVLSELVDMAPRSRSAMNNPKPGATAVLRSALPAADTARHGPQSCWRAAPMRDEMLRAKLCGDRHESGGVVKW